ncbi:MAG: helix-turn-helix domain-containing protein [Spirosomataceae bacterium]
MSIKPQRENNTLKKITMSIKPQRENNTLSFSQAQLEELTKFLRPKEVCQVLKISRPTFERLKKEGRFSTHKIRGSVYVPITDLKALFPKDFLA